MLARGIGVQIITRNRENPTTVRVFAYMGVAIMVKPLVHDTNENYESRDVQKLAVTIPLASRVKSEIFIGKGLGSQLIDLAAANPRRASAKHGSPSATRGTPRP